MIYLGADHRGFELKGKIAAWLSGRGYAFEDKGAFTYDRDDDYVDFAVAVGQAVAKSPEDHRGIVICGSGVGVDVACNKVTGVRCGLGFQADQVSCARKDDNINVLAIAADNCADDQVLMLVEKFFETEFTRSDKYVRRIEKISRYERENRSHGTR